MASIRVVFVDTMVFSYLAALGQIELLRVVSERTGKLAVTAAVVRQLHRAGIGETINSWVRDHKVLEVSPKHGDAVARATASTLSSKDGMLVRRNRVDVELVEVARVERGAVLSCERGIARLSAQRGVTCLDLVDFLAWAIRLAAVDLPRAEEATGKWRDLGGAGSGAPSDFSQTLEQTMLRRRGLPDLLDALMPERDCPET